MNLKALARQWWEKISRPVRKHWWVGAALVALVALVVFMFTPRQRVRRLYRAYLYREPEKQGWESWIRDIAEGRSSWATAPAEFKRSVEAQGLSPTVIAQRKAALKPYLTTLFYQATS